MKERSDMVPFPSSKHQRCGEVLHFLEFAKKVFRTAGKQGVAVIKPRKNKRTDKSVGSTRRENVTDGADLTDGADKNLFSYRTNMDEIAAILTTLGDFAVDDEKGERITSPCSEDLMNRAPIQLDTDILKQKLNSLAARTSRLSTKYDLLMERVELLEQQGRQNSELMAKERKVVLLLEFLMRDDVRANVINDYVIVFLRLVLLKMRQQGHDFDDVLQLSKALDEEEVAFVFRRILRDLDFPENEQSSVLTLLEATKHRKWPSPDTSQVQTSSPAGDAQISSALIYLRAQDELDPQVNASLRRAICLAHESVLSDKAVCEVVPDTNLNDNAADMTVACERACGTSDDDSLVSFWDSHKLLRPRHPRTARSREKQCCHFDKDAILQSQNVFEMRPGIENTTDVFHGVRGNSDDDECLTKQGTEEEAKEKTARDANANGPRLMIWRARRHGVVSCDVGTSTHDVVDSTFDGIDRVSHKSARLTPLCLASMTLDATATAGDASNGEVYSRKQRCLLDTPDRALFETSQMKEKEKEDEDEKEEEEEKPEAKECEGRNEDHSASEEEAEEEDTTVEESSPVGRYSELLEHRYLSAAVEFSTWHYVFDLFDEADGDDNRYREAEDDREQPAAPTAPLTNLPAEKTEPCDCYLS